eukprot:tig00000403_g359.t1
MAIAPRGARAAVACSAISRGRAVLQLRRVPQDRKVAGGIFRDDDPAAGKYAYDKRVARRAAADAANAAAAAVQAPVAAAASAAAPQNGAGAAPSPFAALAPAAAAAAASSSPFSFSALQAALADHGSASNLKLSPEEVLWARFQLSGDYGWEEGGEDEEYEELEPVAPPAAAAPAPATPKPRAVPSPPPRPPPAKRPKEITFDLLVDLPADEEDEDEDEEDEDGTPKSVPAARAAAAEQSKKKKTKRPEKKKEAEAGQSTSSRRPEPEAEPEPDPKQTKLPSGFASYITGRPVPDKYPGMPKHHPSVEAVIYSALAQMAYHGREEWRFFERDGSLTGEGREQRRRLLDYYRAEWGPELVDAILDHDEGFVRAVLETPFGKIPRLDRERICTTVSSGRPLLYAAVLNGCTDAMLRLLAPPLWSQVSLEDKSTKESALRLAVRLRKRSHVQILVEATRGRKDSPSALDEDLYSDGDSILKRVVSEGEKSRDFAIFLVSLGADPSRKCGKNGPTCTPLEVAAKACDVPLLRAMISSMSAKSNKQDLLRRPLALTCSAHSNPSAADAVALLLESGAVPDADSLGAAAEGGDVAFLQLAWSGSAAGRRGGPDSSSRAASPPPRPAAAAPASSSAPGIPKKGLISALFSNVYPPSYSAPLAPGPVATFSSGTSSSSPAKGLICGVLQPTPKPEPEAAALTRRAPSGPPDERTASACLHRTIGKGPSRNEVSKFVVEGWGLRPRLLPANGALLDRLLERRLLDEEAELPLCAPRRDVVGLAALLPRAQGAAGLASRLAGVPLQPLAASAAGRTEEIERLVALGAGLDTVTQDHPVPALLVAAEKKQSATARRLIELGAAIHVARPEDGFTVLHIAATKQDRDLLRAVLNLGARPWPLLAKQAKGRRTPLQVCKDRQLSPFLADAERQAKGPAKRPQAAPAPALPQSPAPSTPLAPAAACAAPASPPKRIEVEEAKAGPSTPRQQIDPALARSALGHLRAKIGDEAAGIEPLPAIAVESTREAPAPRGGDRESDEEEDEEGWMEGLDIYRCATVAGIVAAVGEQAREIQLPKDLYATCKAIGAAGPPSGTASHSGGGPRAAPQAQPPAAAPPQQPPVVARPSPSPATVPAPPQPQPQPLPLPQPQPHPPSASLQEASLILQQQQAAAVAVAAQQQAYQQQVAYTYQQQLAYQLQQQAVYQQALYQQLAAGANPYAQAQGHSYPDTGMYYGYHAERAPVQQEAEVVYMETVQISDAPAPVPAGELEVQAWGGQDAAQEEEEAAAEAAVTETLKHLVETGVKMRPDLCSVCNVAQEPGHSTGAKASAHWENVGARDALYKFCAEVGEQLRFRVRALAQESAARARVTEGDPGTQDRLIDICQAASSVEEELARASREAGAARAWREHLARLEELFAERQSCLRDPDSFLGIAHRAPARGGGGGGEGGPVGGPAQAPRLQSLASLLEATSTAAAGRPDPDAPQLEGGEQVGDEEEVGWEQEKRRPRKRASRGRGRGAGARAAAGPARAQGGGGGGRGGRAGRGRGEPGPPSGAPPR